MNPARAREEAFEHSPAAGELPESGTREVRARRRSEYASCLWLDMSGFTSLAEHLCAQGPTGTESLSAILNQFYGAAASAVAARGGSVLFHAGDAVLCAWTEETAGDSAERLALAIEAALAIRRMFANAASGSPQIRLRQTVLTGALCFDTVGGERNRWIELVTGEILGEIPRLSRLARSGKIVLDAQSAALLPAERSRALGAGAFSLLDTARRGLRAPTVEPPWSPSLTASDAEGWSESPELRKITVAFIGWERVGAPALEDLQSFAACVQQVCDLYGGCAYQMVQDDKGVVALVGFGLPGLARGEDGIRAVRFALHVSSRAAELGLRLRIGVASGEAYCGRGDAPSGRKYRIFGSMVNRAARLSEAAANGPLIDDLTFQHVSRRIACEPHRDVRLRGFARPLRVHRPSETHCNVASPRVFVGFRAQVGELFEAIRTMIRGEGRRVAILAGELGSGKTALLSRVPARCEELGVTVHVSAADELERYTGYSALRNVMRSLLGDPRVPDELATLRAAVERVGFDAEHAPLLNPLVGAALVPGLSLGQMTPHSRAETRKHLVAELLRQRSGARPSLVVIDDAHFLDASSLELIAYLSRQVPCVFWLLAERRARRERSAFETLEVAANIWLNPMEERDVAELVASVAEGRPVPAKLVTEVTSAARGNPLHSMELARALLACQSAPNRLSPEGVEGPAISVPSTLEGLIQSRFDQLSPSARELVRAASVIGMDFEVPLLRMVLRDRLEGSDFDAALEECFEADMVRSRGGPVFEHATIRAAVYGILLPSEQERLHEQTALALQAIHAPHLGAVAARLSYHWGKTKNRERAAKFSALAAEQALQGYANADAAYLFERALSHDAAWRGELKVDLSRARWSSSLAQAFYSLGRRPEARVAYARALRWTGTKIPGASADLVLTLGKHVVNVALRKLRRGPNRQLSGELRERSRAALRVIHEWGALDVWEGRLIEAVNKAFVAYRRAQRVLQSPEAAEVVAGFGYMLASTPMRRYSEPTLLHGVELADGTGDLKARTSTRVLLGMYYTMSGSAERALQPLAAAQSFAARLGSGLWRHRTSFAHGE
ncbi:MAG TPA: AAA family ATPase, partial [Polyangiaceae bacterium]